MNPLPNGSRLSCCALKKISFHNLRAPPASRVLGGSTKILSETVYGPDLFESQRKMSSCTNAVLELRVGREFRTATSAGPFLGRRHK